MSREIPEWVAKHDDEEIPPRVKLRVVLRFNGHCPKCSRALRPRHYAIDHIKALANGGEHRETNLQPLCNSPCHAAKTKDDVAIKAVTYRKQKSHYGIRKAKRSMPGGRDTPWKKKINGEVVRR